MHDYTYLLRARPILPPLHLLRVSILHTHLKCPVLCHGNGVIKLPSYKSTKLEILAFAVNSGCMVVWLIYSAAALYSMQLLCVTFRTYSVGVCINSVLYFLDQHNGVVVTVAASDHMQFWGLHLQSSWHVGIVFLYWWSRFHLLGCASPLSGPQGRSTCLKWPLPTERS